jgi:GT2 family glycosyltransferase
MNTPIILITTKKRKNLLEQTLRTLQDNTQNFDLIFKEDQYQQYRFGVGLANKAIRELKQWDNVVFIDDDLHFSQGWLDLMLSEIGKNDVWLLGGCTYPRHKIIEEKENVNIMETLAGTCIVISRSTWEKVGEMSLVNTPLIWDAEYCQRIQKAGGKVAVLKDKTKVVHCGLTGNNGKGRSSGIMQEMRTLCESVGAIYC